MILSFFFPSQFTLSSATRFALTMKFQKKFSFEVFGDRFNRYTTLNGSRKYNDKLYKGLFSDEDIILPRKARKHQRINEINTSMSRYCMNYVKFRGLYEKL